MRPLLRQCIVRHFRRSVCGAVTEIVSAEGNDTLCLRIVLAHQKTDLAVRRIFRHTSKNVSVDFYICGSDVIGRRGGIHIVRLKRYFLRGDHIHRRAFRFHDLLRHLQNFIRYHVLNRVQKIILQTDHKNTDCNNTQNSRASENFQDSTPCCGTCLFPVFLLITRFNSRIISALGTRAFMYVFFIRGYMTGRIFYRIRMNSLRFFCLSGESVQLGIQMKYNLIVILSFNFYILLLCLMQFSFFGTDLFQRFLTAPVLTAEPALPHMRFPFLTHTLLSPVFPDSPPDRSPS